MSEWLVELVRGLIAFFTLLIFARVLGKQQISQLTFFDYVLGITIGSTASSLTTDLTSKAFPHWIGLITWIGSALALQIITLKWRTASKYIDGEPTVVVMNGQIMEDTMARMRYRATDLLEQLRNKGVFDLGQVEFAVLETNGKLSVQKKSQYQPVTPKDLNLPTQYKGLSTELIYDGVVIEQNLRGFNLDRIWLTDQLKKQGINSEEEVFLALIDTGGQLYIDKYSDHVKKLTDVSDYPGAN
ncbi:DUF421 domain-containing protein [Metallumcola ferriviriculae]|uniref:DUF421 domain-containing protein n=1 Tax=Metallumcola ferriviriculae TaxID=3039180 RepID=A0AAU0ULJ3_9FIRM|nr:DUF421 domain-containing protein [Desulfitibacteraceae bacterium MK1]